MKSQLELGSRKILFFKMLVCTAMIILFGTMQAQAMDMHHGRHQGMHQFKWWQIPKLSKELNLTAGEKQSLDNLFVKNRDMLVDLKSSLMKDRFKLHDMLEKDTVDEASVLAQNKVISEDKLKISDEHIKYILGIKKILGPDRSHKLMVKFHEMRGMKHSHKGKEFSHEPKE